MGWGKPSHTHFDLKPRLPGNGDIIIRPDLGLFSIFPRNTERNDKVLVSKDCGRKFFVVSFESWHNCDLRLIATLLINKL